VAEHLCDTADLHAGWRVLDVATGSGNAAIAAARLGCTAIGVDYVPTLLERGRQRAAAEGLPVELLEGDAESLPFPDDSFDAVTSVFGSMFAPDHARAAAELLRVCRPGGTIALASWTPEGFIGELFRTVGEHVPPPAGVPSPMLWGTEGHLRQLAGDDDAALAPRRRVARVGQHGQCSIAFEQLQRPKIDLARASVSLTLEPRIMRRRRWAPLQGASPRVGGARTCE
jgi:SAM-dependent methyltransferase